jgi:hypothetical protein
VIANAPAAASRLRGVGSEKLMKVGMERCITVGR